MKGCGGPTLVHLGTAPNREGWGVPSLSIGLAAPNREGLGGFHPSPCGWPLQIVKGWGLQSLSIWEPLQIVNVWGVPSLNFWGAAPTREGLGGVLSLSCWAAIPSREELGGFNPCPFREPVQIVKGWGVQPLSRGQAAPNREGLGGATLVERMCRQKTFGFRVYPLYHRGRCPKGRHAWCQSPSYTSAPRTRFLPPRSSAASGSAVAVVEPSAKTLGVWG